MSYPELEGCLRCWPGEEGLGGFFVVGFVREENDNNNNNSEDDEEWEGFSD